MQFLDDENGATAIEYAVLTGLLGAFLFAALSHLKFDDSMSEMNTAMASAGKSDASYDGAGSDGNNNCASADNCKWD